ncbi:MAG TPA: 3-phosphoserine/phosphohydroxythreonine transaminase [Blastocatellia bacterium]|nr:3-phosphoserine/phosphohydroxythreonine transaminase [Blastocatellia bacterium]
MTSRIFNFSAGPAVMPEPVLERAREELLSLGGAGMGVMEMSHRSPEFESVLHKAEAGIRELLGLPANYRVLFTYGGATMQFSMVPMNLLAGGHADYITTGAWSEKAIAEARRFARVNEIFSTKGSGFRSVPADEDIVVSAGAAYVHYCSNETIDGVEFHFDLDTGGIPAVCDASSNILSRPIDVSKYALIYAGAQKNIGPSGVTVVIIREDMLERIPDGLPLLLDYRTYASADSMPNTPNTWGIYLIGLVTDWLREQGGLAAMAERNREKAKLLYEAVDASDGFYRGHAERAARSLMNVTFRLASEELEERFCTEAERCGMSGLRGHRSVGGIRASIYNAFPQEGVEELKVFMNWFIEKFG